MNARRVLRSTGWLLAGSLALASAHAHLGWSEYDSSKALTLTGNRSKPQELRAERITADGKTGELR